MNHTLLLAAAVLGFLSFFEPCTIATHTLFAVRTNLEQPAMRWRLLAYLMLSRTMLLSAIFISAALVGLSPFSAQTAMLILSVLGLIYLISRKIYLPVPHLEFFRLLPRHDNLTQGSKLGLTLPACTVPLVAIISMLSAINHQPIPALLAGFIFAMMFTLPTLWHSMHKITVTHRTILAYAARYSPYLTTLLLWGSALLIWKTGT